jgi:hypothetical protein
MASRFVPFTDRALNFTKKIDFEILLILLTCTQLRDAHIFTVA